MTRSARAVDSRIVTIDTNQDVPVPEIVASTADFPDSVSKSAVPSTTPDWPASISVFAVACRVLTVGTGIISRLEVVLRDVVMPIL